jgi:hypothetical protein
LPIPATLHATQQQSSLSGKPFHNIVHLFIKLI